MLAMILWWKYLSILIYFVYRFNMYIYIYVYIYMYIYICIHIYIYTYIYTYTYIYIYNIHIYVKFSTWYIDVVQMNRCAAGETPEDQVLTKEDSPRSGKNPGKRGAEVMGNPGDHYEIMRGQWWGNYRQMIWKMMGKWWNRKGKWWANDGQMIG